VRRLWVTIASPDLPPDGLRILHLSNMHFTGRGAGLQDSISYALIGPELNRKLLAAQGEPVYDALAPRSPLPGRPAAPRHPRLGDSGAAGEPIDPCGRPAAFDAVGQHAERVGRQSAHGRPGGAVVEKVRRRIVARLGQTVGAELRS